MQSSWIKACDLQEKAEREGERERERAREKERGRRERERGEGRGGKRGGWRERTTHDIIAFLDSTLMYYVS